MATTTTGSDSLGMISPFVKLCGEGAPVASVGLYMAPIPTIRQIVQSGTVGSLPLLPYTSMASNAFMWMIYGFMKKEPKVWSCNLVGFLLALGYCLLFIQNIKSHKGGGTTSLSSTLEMSTPTLPGTVKQHVRGVSAVVAGTLSFALSKPFADNSAAILGNVAVLVCLVMFASPLSVMKVVLETKSAKSIPLPLAVVSCLNCFMWTVYGWFAMRDANIYFPNLLGLLSGIAQISLKLKFGDHDHHKPAYAGVDVSP